MSEHAVPGPRSTVGERARPGVLMVGNFLSPHGHNRSVGEELAMRLQASGWQVICTSSRLGRASRLADMLTTAVRSRSRYQIAQVDVFSGSAFVWAEAVCRTLQMLRKPFVLTLHGGNLPSYAQHRPRRVANMLSAASVVTTPSGYLLDQMQSFRCDLILLPNPLELSNYEFKVRRCCSPNLVWLRAFHELYNPALAVRVLAQLAAVEADVRLTMIGPDKGTGTFQETQRLAAQLGLTERIHFVPGVPKIEVPSWLSQYDIFLNTTNADNTPVSVMEAMASGLPVVSTNVGGIPHLLTHEEDALLVPPGDQAMFAAATSRILQEKTLAERLSRNGRSRIEAFDWELILPRWQQIFETYATADQPRVSLR